MKCEKCNEKEATFYYSCNINGKKTERHLCPDCARAEGFGKVMDYDPVSSFEREMDRMFSGFFSPARALMSDFGFFGSPMRSIMAPAFPEVNILVGSPQEKTAENLSETESRIPDDAGAEIKAKREIEGLRHQLDEAVRTENFEKAIELRDKLRQLEK